MICSLFFCFALVILFLVLAFDYWTCSLFLMLFFGLVLWSVPLSLFFVLWFWFLNLCCLALDLVICSYSLCFAFCSCYLWLNWYVLLYLFCSRYSFLFGSLVVFIVFLVYVLCLFWASYSVRVSGLCSWSCSLLLMLFVVLCCKFCFVVVLVLCYWSCWCCLLKSVVLSSL